MATRPPVVLALIFSALLAVPPVVLHAAIAATELLSGSTTNAGNANSVDSGASTFTPTANALIYVCIANQKASAPDLPTGVYTSGGAITFTLVDSRVNSIDTTRISTYRGMTASPATSALFIDYAGPPISVQWKVTEFTGVDTSGTNGSGAIVQTVTGDVGAANTVLTLTTASWADATNNAAKACYYTQQSTTFTAEAGWTELGVEDTEASPSGTLGSMWRVGQDTTATGTMGINGRLTGIVSEIKMASSGTTACIGGGGLISPGCPGMR